MDKRDEQGRKLSSQIPNKEFIVPSANDQKFNAAMKAQDDPKFEMYKKGPPVNPIGKTGLEVLTDELTQRGYDALKKQFP